MRVAVVDPQAYTPPYDDELCRALAAAGAEVELLTAHFTHGAAPVPHGYVRRELFGPPLARPARATADLAPARVPLKLGGHATGLARLVRRVRSSAPRRRALAVGAAAALDLRALRAAGTQRRRRRSSRPTTCCRAARATRRRCGPSSTAAATA